MSIYRFDNYSVEEITATEWRISDGEHAFTVRDPPNLRKETISKMMDDYLRERQEDLSKEAEYEKESSLKQE